VRARNLGILGVAGTAVAAAIAAPLVRRLLRGKSSLAELTKDELYERAQAADVQGRSKMTKDELVGALESEGEA
jgi:hypothetical protein